jgi:hypothetical protein
MPVVAVVSGINPHITTGVVIGSRSSTPLIRVLPYYHCHNYQLKTLYSSLPFKGEQRCPI